MSLTTRARQPGYVLHEPLFFVFVFLAATSTGGRVRSRCAGWTAFNHHSAQGTWSDHVALVVRHPPTHPRGSCIVTPIAVSRSGPTPGKRKNQSIRRRHPNARNVRLTHAVSQQDAAQLFTRSAEHLAGASRSFGATSTVCLVVETPDVLRPDSARLRGSMAIRLRPGMT